ncbi:acetate/propionate family kinase [Pseudactinotalea sp.]|uniref:acetate/propionate family kinase n=1 Tax=Pseudactinotalea sp. TaxID=1926260 RepID=UPI003B3A9E2E
MSKPVLVINSGSSSLKYQVVDAESGEALAVGLIERIGGAGPGALTHTVGGEKHPAEVQVPDHAAAMAAMSDAFAQHGPDLAEVGLVAVGHRVVQGGARFGHSVHIDEEALATIEQLSDLAPLHNPANAAGIRVARAQFPDLPHVAVFDTAFHLTMPEVAHTYAIDREVAEEHRIRRYGFHGTSHAYVSQRAAEFLGQPLEDTNVIVLHLGNGASACAVRGGISVDTSMGLTPLEGLVMGTRSGDIDPAVVFHLARTAGMDIDAVDTLLNKRSGVLGLSGRQDMRDLVEAAAAGEPEAQLALEVYCYRVRKYIGAYLAVLGRVDAIVFTAGIGENSAEVRALTLEGLAGLGIELDGEANLVRSGEARDIATSASRVRVLVIPTNEELEIARQAIDVVGTRSSTYN